MKSFVRKIEASNRWLVLTLGVGAIMLFLAAEATNGLAYLPFYAVLLIDLARSGVRRIRKRSKALPAAARNRGSR